MFGKWLVMLVLVDLSLLTVLLYAMILFLICYFAQSDEREGEITIYIYKSSIYVYMGFVRCKHVHQSNLWTAFWAPPRATPIHGKVGIERSYVTHLCAKSQVH